MTFEEKWDIYKKANLSNWLYEVGDKSPINTLLEYKYDAFRIGWESATKRAEEIAENWPGPVAKRIAQKIRE